MHHRCTVRRVNGLRSAARTSSSQFETRGWGQAETPKLAVRWMEPPSKVNVCPSTCFRTLSAKVDTLRACREAFRHVNFLADIALTSFVGQGARGYHLALEEIARRFGSSGG